MVHIDTVLSLYPDASTRRRLLEEALAHLHDDLATLRVAVTAGDFRQARQQAHRAKGTASFLGHVHALPAFDRLAAALDTGNARAVGPFYARVEELLLGLEIQLRQHLAAL